MDYTEFEEIFAEQIEKEMCKRLSLEFDKLSLDEIEDLVNSNLDLYREVVDILATAHGGVYD